MKKNMKIAIAVAILLPSVVVGYYSYTLSQQNRLADANPILEENIEALTRPEVNNDDKLWFRKDEDCVYTITGKIGSVVNIKVGSLGSISIKIGADGKGTYIYSGGKTNCTANGNELCEARYCPNLLK